MRDTLVQQRMSEKNSPPTEECSTCQTSTSSHSEDSRTSGSHTDVDLDDSKNACALKSEALTRIKREFLEKLPASSELQELASTLRAPQDISTTQKTEGQDKNDAQTTSVFTAISNYVSDTYTSLLKKFSNNAAHLVDSVADVKEWLAKNPDNNEGLQEQFATLQPRLQQLDQTLAMLKENLSDEQFAKLTQDPRFKRILAARKEYDAMLSTACSCSDEIHSHFESDGVSKADRAQSAQAKRKLEQSLAEDCKMVDEQMTEAVETLLDSTASAEEQERCTSNCLAAVSAGTTHIQEEFDRFSKTELTIAQESGNKQLLHNVRQSIHHAQKRLRAHQRVINRLTETREVRYPEGWQTGLSFEHYIHNLGNMFASALNQFDLNIIRKNKAQQRERYIIDSTKPEESRQPLTYEFTKAKIPRHFEFHHAIPSFSIKFSDDTQHTEHEDTRQTDEHPPATTSEKTQK